MVKLLLLNYQSADLLFACLPVDRANNRPGYTTTTRHKAEKWQYNFSIYIISLLKFFPDRQKEFFTSS